MGEDIRSPAPAVNPSLGGRGRGTPPAPPNRRAAPGVAPVAARRTGKPLAVLTASPRPPRKILFVSTLYAPHNVGGAEATVRQLAEETVRRGREAVVATLSPDGEARTAEVGGVRVHYLPLANLFFLHDGRRRPALARRLWHLLDAWNPVMAGRLGRILDREAPDVVNTHNLQGFSVAAWAAVSQRGLPLVQTLHDYYTACANSAMFRDGGNCASPCRDCRLLGIARRRLSGRPDVVTTVSRRLFERIHAAGVFTRTTDVRVIRNANAADPPLRPPSTGGPLRIGFLGRLEPVKGLELLFEAVSRLPAGAVSLAVGGTGEAAYVADLRRRYEGPGVRFDGWVEPERFLTEIDVLAVPSVWEEPLSRVSHEAMGQGVPVIGARIGGIPEIVRDGETGWLFTPGDAGDLAHVLDRLIVEQPDWNAVALRCRTHAEAFRLDAVYAAYEEAWAAACRR
jgi:glycosyltransferase involved in cell wall biosynthesis